MGDPGFLHFPGSLDPRAQEFRPTNYLTLVPPHIYYPYPCPPYPFCEGGVGYAQFSSPPAYVSPTTADPPLPPNLPPPSSTPSRTLLLSSVPADVSESTVRRELEVFGDVRAVQMERVRDGIVTVHFYDLRDAQTALIQIQEQHMQQQCRLRNHFDSLILAHNSLYEQKNLVPPLPPPARGLIAGRAVWAQFMIPVTVGLPGGHNQGTLVIFNLDSEVPTTSLKEIFDTFGCVKELRETPLKKHQRFVEFYDIRDAAKSLEEMNGKEIYGKHVVIEFSRPGGYTKKFLKATQNTTNKFNSPTNLPTKTSQCPPLPPPPPPPPPRKIPYMPPRISNSQPQSCPKKSSFSKGNPVEHSNIGSTKSGAVSLCLNSGIGIGIGIIEESSNRHSKKSCKKFFGSVTITSSTKQQQQSKGGSRTWKGSRKCKDFDPRFLINQDAIMESNCRDSRTTVMIKNIPNKYSQKLLLNMLDNHCIHCNEQIADGDEQPLSSYDFVYLPIDFINKCNVGYGFVNMTSPQATLRLYKAFHLQNWEVFNSRKICEVTYARLQGVEALKEHFKNSKFPCEADEYMPVVFTPPRDGRRLTEPITIAGRANTNSSPSPPAVTSSEPTDDVMDGGYLPHPHFGESINVNHNDDGEEDDVSGGRSRSSSSTNGGDVYDQDGK